MPYSPHVKIQWGGHIRSTTSGTTDQEVEEWSCTMSAIRAGGGLAMASLQTAVATHISNFHTRGTSGIHSTVALDYVKVNEVDAEGHQITDPTQVTFFTPPLRGGAGATNIYPLSMATKVTLDDGTRNRRAKGGFYVPRPNMNLEYTGRYVAGGVTNLLASAQTMINAISAETGITIAVASKVDASLTPVTRIRVGDVPDNVSRRRNGLVETYQAGVITP